MRYLPLLLTMVLESCASMHHVPTNPRYELEQLVSHVAGSMLLQENGRNCASTSIRHSRGRSSLSLTREKCYDAKNRLTANTLNIQITVEEGKQDYRFFGDRFDIYRLQTREQDPSKVQETLTKKLNEFNINY